MKRSFFPGLYWIETKLQWAFKYIYNYNLPFDNIHNFLFFWANLKFYITGPRSFNICSKIELLIKILPLGYEYTI
jgi:hypothetical protein